MSAARHMLITAGPTHEPIDAVRYLANRSSGRLGFALAVAARDAGWNVTLLLGPVAAEPPTGITTTRYTSTADLAELLAQHFPQNDVLIMAAAVADYRPSRVSAGKLLRAGEKRLLELEPTPDLVAACAAQRRTNQQIVAFALEEPAMLEQRATEKLARKNVDAIVANPLRTMGAADIEPLLFTSAGRTTPPVAKMDKPAFARWLIGWIDTQWPRTNDTHASGP